MQPPTLPPWLSPWSSGLLYGQRVYKDTLRERYRPRDRHRPRLTIYTYNHDNSHTHSILRIGGWGAGSQGGVSSSGTASNTVRPLVGWERYGVDRDPPWRLAVPPPPSHDIYRQLHMKLPESQDPLDSHPASHASESSGWGSARGWVAGTALLALLVVLARAAENCIDKRFFKGRRRSEEWPTPNVMATSQQQQDSENGTTGEGGSLPSLSVDLPPPYSACATLSPSLRSSSPKPPDYPEDPPPPYSDCYVEFSNKNGIPSVLIFSRRRNSIFNRHEILGNRSEDEPSTSDGRIDDNDAIMLEDVVVERDLVNQTTGRNDDDVDRRTEAINNDSTTELRTKRSNDDDVTERRTVRMNELNDNVIDRDAKDHRESEPSISNATNINDLPTAIVCETNVIRDNNNAQVV